MADKYKNVHQDDAGALRLDGTKSPTAEISWNSQNIVSVGEIKWIN